MGCVGKDRGLDVLEEEEVLLVAAVEATAAICICILPNKRFWSR